MLRAISTFSRARTSFTSRRKAHFFRLGSIRVTCRDGKSDLQGQTGKTSSAADVGEPTSSKAQETAGENALPKVTRNDF